MLGVLLVLLGSMPFPRLHQFALPILLSAGLSGCAAEQVEDFALSDKEDSFASPTEHGLLNFERGNPGEFTDSLNFHSWTFELTGTADLDVLSEVSNNLDTVMFLYRRDPGATNWGRNIAKNDDHGNSLGSRIQIDNAEAGEYRVKLKTAKMLFRGGFELLASCSGAGCPTPVALPTDFAPLPTEGMTEDCAGEFIDIISSKTKITQAGAFVDFPDPELSGLSVLEHKAIGHYVSYWDDVVGFGIFGDPRVTVGIRETASGFVVDVDAEGSDESGMTMVYTSSEELVMLYQHNQSPDERWYCDESAGNVVGVPELECAIELIRSMSHSEEDSSDQTNSMSELENQTLDSRVQRAVEAFAADHSPDPAEDIHLFIDTWDDDGAGAAIGFDSNFAIGTYYVSGDNQLMAHSNEEGETFLACEGF